MVRRSLLAPIVSPRKNRNIKETMEPTLNLPSGLKLAGIRTHDHIPDKYVKDNFPFEVYRGKRIKYSGGYPLTAMLVKHLAGVTTHSDHRNRSSYYDDEYDDERYEANNLRGIKVDTNKLKQALKEILESPSLFILFDTVELASYNEESYEDQNTYSKIILRKKEVIYDTDEQVIVKIKRKIFTEIQRYRRAKKGA